jgi:hypothetical protein
MVVGPIRQPPRGGGIKRKMTLRITALVAVTTLTLLLMVVPAVKAWAQAETETREHHIFITVQEQKEKYTQLGEHPTPPGWDPVALTQKILQEERILGVVYDDFTLRAKAISEIADLESQMSDSERRSDLSKMMDLFGDFIIPQAYAVTEDDGYVYPKNATDEEKAAIDVQELKAWEEVGRPGELRPYCDELQPNNRTGIVCHDRKDYSDVTGLYTCRDGTHEADWQDCQ